MRAKPGYLPLSRVRGGFQTWQNMEAGGRYFPRGTNVLLCTVVGDFYDSLSRMSEEEVRSALIGRAPHYFALIGRAPHYCALIGRELRSNEILSKVLEEMFSVLTNMYGDRAVRPQEIFIPGEICPG